MYHPSKAIAIPAQGDVLTCLDDLVLWKRKADAFRECPAADIHWLLRRAQSEHQGQAPALLFQACTESLTSENATRLAAMQRAEKNIDELLVTFQDSFHRLRQSSIDEELFDVVSGFEALS